MNEPHEKIGLGGGCHWCTEAIFKSVEGVKSVEQGYIASLGDQSSFSEGVIVNYNPESVKLKTLIEIHLITHQSAVNHSMRNKYRSAIYTFSDRQKTIVEKLVQEMSKDFSTNLITKILDFSDFKTSRPEIQNYYFKDVNRPFCKKFIDPKLKILMNTYSRNLKMDQLTHLI